MSQGYLLEYPRLSIGTKAYLPLYRVNANHQVAN
jgi:hypothetical protein